MESVSQIADDISPQRSGSLSSSTSSGVISLTQASSTSETSTTSETSSTISSSSTTSSSTSETSTITPTSTPSALPVETTTSANGSTYYVTLYTTPTPSPSIQAAPSNSSGFLQNKTLSGVVFAIVGVAGLVILVAAATIAIRRSRRHRLHAEAVSFDPTSQLDRDSTEKRRFSLLSSDNGHGGGTGGNLGGGYFGTSPTALVPPAYSRQDSYRFPASESQHNLIGHPQQPWYGGAAVNGGYSATHAPLSDPRPAWMYGNESIPAQPSKTPTPPDRAISPENGMYPQAGNLKVCDTRQY